jgi:flagellar protein FliO/FliZ
MSLLGGMPFPVQFFLAFVIVLGLIGATAWAVRRFGAGRLGGGGLRGRQPRLAVIDYASVDGRRRLILVRRDNVEHLVMIGGPTDVVVEANIVRATAPPRDASLARPAAADMLPRAVPVPDSAANGSWTGQPEPAVPSSGPRAPRGELTPEEPTSVPLQPHVEVPSRAQRDTLAALADELSTKPAASPRGRSQAAARPRPPDPRQEPRPEPRLQAVPPAAAEPVSAADQSLADMAHRLEAALRKSNAKADRTDAQGAPAPRAAAPTEQAAPADPSPAPAPAPPAPPSAAAPRAARVSEGKANPGKALYDSLEQEMASLLGRPTARN